MIDQEPRNPIAMRRSQQSFPLLHFRAESHPWPRVQISSAANGFIDDSNRWRIDPDVVPNEILYFLYGVWLIAAEVGPDKVDDVGPSVESWVDDSGAFVRSLRTVVEFGNDEALVRIVVLLVLCEAGWLD